MTEKEKFATIQIMELWNKIETKEHEKFEAEKHKKEEAISKIEQMNKAKETRKEVKEKC